MIEPKVETTHSFSVKATSFVEMVEESLVLARSEEVQVPDLQRVVRETTERLTREKASEGGSRSLTSKFVQK